MGVYSMLTDTGLSQINLAQDSGILVEVAYWVTAYDKSLADDYATDPATANNIANYTTPSDLYPNFGQINTPEFDPQNMTYHIFWHTSGIPDNQAEPAPSDIYRGVTYQSVCDTNATNPRGYFNAKIASINDAYPTTRVEGDYWIIGVEGDPGADASGVVGGIYYATGDTMVYNGVAFVNGVGENYRGNFKLTVQDSEKTLYVNKIGLYAIMRSIDGTIKTNPFLLGQVIIPQTQVIQPGASNDSSSVDQLIVDFQIDTQAAMIDFDNIIYASENDYWQRVAIQDGIYGLQYDGSIYVTNTLGVEDDIGANTSDISVGKALIATFETVNKPNPDEEATMPQLALQYVKTENNGVPSQNAFSPRIRTTFRTTPFGDCELNMYGACNNEFGYYAVTSKIDGEHGLGNNNNRWRLLKTSERIDMYLGENYQRLDVTVTNASTEIIQVGASVEVTNPSGVPYIEVRETTQTTSFGVAMVQILPGGSGRVSTRRDDRWDYIKKGVLNETDNTYSTTNITQEYGYVVMKNNDLSANINLGLGHFGNSSIEVGPHYDSRDIADKDTTPWLQWKENYFYTYGNISNYIAGVDALDGTQVFRPYPLNIRSTEELSMYTISSDNVSKYENAGLTKTSWHAGALAITSEIENMIEQGSNWLTPNFVLNFTGQNTANGGKHTIYANFYSIATWDASVKGKLSNLVDVRNSLYGSEFITGDPVGGSTIQKDILIASSRYIYTFGEILPMVDNLNNLGGSNHAYRSIYVGTVYGINYPAALVSYDGVEYYQYGGWNMLTLNGDVVPARGSTTSKITRNLDGERYEYINCENLGGLRIGDGGIDYIDKGYITNIFTDSIIIGSNLTLTSDHISGTGLTIGSDTEAGRINVLYVNTIDLLDIKGLDTINKSVVYTYSFDFGEDSIDVAASELNTTDSWQTTTITVFYGLLGITKIVISTEFHAYVYNDWDLGNDGDSWKNVMQQNELQTLVINALIADDIFVDTAKAQVEEMWNAASSDQHRRREYNPVFTKIYTDGEYVRSEAKGGYDNANTDLKRGDSFGTDGTPFTITFLASGL